MTNPFFSTQNSGLKVFSACLLSSLLVMMPFVQMAAAANRAETRGQSSKSGQQTADSRQQNTATNAAPENVSLNAPVPKAAPEPLVGPVIVATKDDGLATATTVAPGGTINYSVNIKNNGTTSPADDATGVTFTDIIDAHTTLVVDSAVAAVSDRYNAIGNVLLSIPDGSTDLLGNDIDPDTGSNVGMTATAETKSSTACTGGCSNNVTINANGSFTYDPPVGFSGTDTFTYTAHSTVGGGTAIETVTITVANEIWFIDRNSSCVTDCNGRLSHPFTSLASFNAANLGGAGQPGDNDWIFIYESATDYTGPATLRLGQKFIGQDATASLSSLTGFPAASGTDQLPVMNSGNGIFVNIAGTNVNGINLNSGNTLRGFRVGNVGTGTKISGTSFGTLLVGNSGAPDVLLHGTGRALNLTTGTLAVTGGFISVTTTSSASQGISLSGVADSDGAAAGAFSFGSTTVGSSTSEGILVAGSTADLSFGTTSVTGGTDGISLQNNSAGTRTFGALGITGSSGIGFRHLDPDGATITQTGGGNVTVTGAATLSSAGSAISVISPAATTAINFQGATSATTTGVGITAVNWVGAANTSMTFNSLSIERNGTVANPAIALNASGGGTINVTNGTGSINNTTAVGSAIIAANIALNANFSAINSTGSTNAGGLNGVSLTSVSGTSNFGGGLLTGSSGGATFLIAGGSCSVTYSGNITQGAAAAMVSINGGHSSTGAVTFSGTLSATLGTGLQFDNADSTGGGGYVFSGTTTLGNGTTGDAGIDLTNDCDGTFSFNSNTTINNPSGIAYNEDTGSSNVTYSGTITKTNNANNAVNINAKAGGTTAFSGAITASTTTANAIDLTSTAGTVNFTGGLSITTSTGTGFNATGTGATVSATQNNSTILNTISSVGGIGLNVTNTIGASGLTFRSITASGAANGIVLNGTGANGLTVTGNGGSCTTAGSCTGGAITNTTGDGVSLTSANNVSLTRMFFQNIADAVSNNATCDLDTATGCSAAIDIQGTSSNVALDQSVIDGDDGVDGAGGANPAGQIGISGHGVNGLSVKNTTIKNVGESNDESGVLLTDAQGTVLFRDVTITDPSEYGIRVYKSANTTIELTLQRVTVQNSISTFGEAGFSIRMDGGTAHVLVDDCDFLNTDGPGVDAQAINAAILHATIQASVFSENLALPMAVNFTTDNTSQGFVKITNNTVNDCATPANCSVAFDLDSNRTSTLHAIITNNNVPTGTGIGTGMEFIAGDGSFARAEVRDNNITVNAGEIGSTFQIRNEGFGGTNGRMDVIYEGNAISGVSSGGLFNPGVQFLAGSSTGSHDQDMCVNIATSATAGGNTITGTNSPGLTPRFEVSQRTGTTFLLQGFVGTGTNQTDVENHFNNNNNPGNLDPTFVRTGGTTPAVIQYAAGTCNAPTTPTLPPVVAMNFLMNQQREYLVSAEVDKGEATATGSTNFWTSIASSFTNSTVEAGGVIALQKSENRGHDTELSTHATDVKSAIATKVDAVNTHHALSSKLETRNETSDEETGLRAHSTTLSKLANRNATAAPVPMSGETVTANIGTLPAGGSVTVSFQVTVNNPPNLTLLSPPRVENQGTVSGGNFASVLTDDPNVVGAADKTATRIDLYGTTTTVISGGSPSDEGDPVTFTATVAPNNLPFAPPGGTNPTGTVQFLDGATPITCNEGSTSIQTLNGSSQATCTTSALTSAGSPHTINVNYVGDGNFDPSNGNTSHVINACTQNPVVINTNDSGAGSLREAIATVCTAPNNNITFNIDPGAGPHTITLTTGALVAAKNANIKNSSGESITVSGGGTSGVFSINAGKTVSIVGLSITGGSAANGAGVLNNGTLTLVSSTVFSNTATSDGGGIQSTASATSLTLINTTVSSNNTNGFGGGVDVLGGTATIINSTITGNHGDNDDTTTGGAGGVRQQAGTVTLQNTIVAGNYKGSGTTTPNDIEGTVTGSNNLVGDAATSGGLTHGTNGNIVGNAGSGTIVITTVLNTMLALNGGLTATHALVASGPAVEAGSNANLPVDTFDLDGDLNTAETLPVDQRGTGYPRTADSADANATQTVDIGAFELHPSVEDITDKTTSEDNAVPQITFNLGDGTGALISTVTATSGNTTLIPNANILVGGSGTTRTLDISPAADTNTPTDGTATITVTVTATNGQTAVDTFVVTVTEVNDAPVPTNDTVSDVDEDCATGCTAGKYVIPFATLLANDTNKGAANESGQTVNITAVSSPTGGTVAINGTDVEFTPTANYFGVAGFTYTVTDNGTTNAVSDPKTGNATVSFNITAVNDPPSFTIAADPPAVNEDAPAQTVPSFATSISQGPGESGQTLTFNLTPTGSTGTLTFSSGPAIDPSGTLTYTPTGNTDGTATFSVTLSDNGSNTPPNSNTSAAQTFTITVNAQNDAPVVTTTVANLSYTENDPATAVDSLVTVTDIDSANLTGASVSVTTNFQSGQDVLAWVDNNLGDSITLDGSSTAQTIVLTGSDTPANYQAALRAVTYVNTSENPSTLTRTVTFTANDGATTGQGTRNITVNAQNDNPTLTTNAGLTVNNAGTGTIDNTKLKVDDVDNTAAQITFTVTAVPTNGTLKKNNIAVAVSGTFTQADIDGNLITYTHNGTATTTDSFTFTVSDGAGGSIGSTTFNITIGNPNVSINDAQVVEPTSGTADMTFTVALAAPAGATGASVNFQTNNGTANAGTCGNPGADYVSSSGTVNFIPGEQVKTINVPVCSDAVADDGETFTVTLSSPVNAVIVDGTATGTITGNTPGTLLISELRTSGPNGTNDDFVEIYNNTNAAITVPAGGYGLFKKGADCNGTGVLSGSPVLVGVIPATTVIPARGHFLFVGSTYSLGSYPGAGSGPQPNATNDATLTADIENDANVGLFSTADITLISSVNRLDAVGFGLNTGGTCNLLREGNTLPPMSGSTLQYSYFRKMCDWVQGLGCTVNGVPKDTNNNSDDFWLADTTAAAITSRLGAPGPENLSSPIRRDSANNPGSGGINVFLLDGSVGSAAAPNRKRDGSDPAGTFGSMTLRYRVTNNTGGNVTRLRYRIVDASTAIQPAGPNADLRALTSSIEPTIGPVNDSVTCTAGGAGAPPCSVTVTATTLETPPAQSIGGGYNSTLSSGTITTGAPLNNGNSILINFKLGVEKTGQFRFYIIVEALP